MKEVTSREGEKSGPGGGKCGAFAGISITLFGWRAGVDRGRDRENGQVGSAQKEPWMPGSGCFWMPQRADGDEVRQPRAPGGWRSRKMGIT